MNYVFYVCDSIPQSGHFRKMDAEYEIAGHIKNGLKDCIIKKYTEYDGTVIDAESVGVVFPTHTWGVSLAVYSFLQNLRVTEKTHLYAVILGESISFEAETNTTILMKKIIDKVNSLRMKYNLVKLDDIYIRSDGYTRDIKCVETLVRGKNNIKTFIKHIMESLLLFNIDTLKELAAKTKERLGAKYREQIRERELDKKYVRETSIKLSNVFLDDSMFEGVRLCQVM